MNIGCSPEINVRLWQLRRTCSRLEPRGWACRLMDALNRHHHQKQLSHSPLPLPSSVWGQAFGNTREISQCRKQTDYRTIP